jgi:hypothetical protein
MHIQILDLISWLRETNLFGIPLYLTIIKKSMQMQEVPKPNYDELLDLVADSKESADLCENVGKIIFKYYILVCIYI